MDIKLRVPREELFLIGMEIRSLCQVSPDNEFLVTFIVILSAVVGSMCQTQRSLISKEEHVTFPFQINVDTVSHSKVDYGEPHTGH